MYFKDRLVIAFTVDLDRIWLTMSTSVVVTTAVLTSQVTHLN